MAVIRPPRFNARLVIHPASEGALDRLLCRLARRAILREAQRLNPLTKTALAERLGINRGRLDSFLATLDLLGNFEQIKHDNRAKNA